MESQPRPEQPEPWADSGVNRVLIFDTTLRDGEQSPGAGESPGESHRPVEA